MENTTIFSSSSNSSLHQQSSSELRFVMGSFSLLYSTWMSSSFYTFWPANLSEEDLEHNF